MANLRVQRRRGTRGDDGASLVEFALIAPLLFVLLIGTFTTGLALSRQNSVKNAVREGTRLGAIYPVDDNDASTTNDIADYLVKVYSQVEGAATQDLDDDAPGKYICVAYIDEANDKWKKEDGDASVSPDTDWCWDDGRSDEARIQVLARRESTIDALFISHPVTLESRAVTRYERQANP